jgi:hypothetical protein
LHFQDGDIEGTAAEIIDGNDRVVCAVETVSQGGSRRFIDDSENLKAGDLTSVLSCLPLRIIEVRRNGDDGMAED